jgi:hypothetical protein
MIPNNHNLLQLGRPFIMRFQKLIVVWTVLTPRDHNDSMNQSRVYLLTALLILVGLARPLLGQTAVATDECGRTAGMQVYSNVYLQEETGDVLGYDLALKSNGDLEADALLYVYEGGNSDEGVPLSGQISKSHLSIQGTWVEHLVEYPSKKEIVQTHSVKIVGTLDSTVFRGELTIEGMGEREHVKLKRVKRIWSCKK